jgi:hypothetical protein
MIEDDGPEERDRAGARDERRRGGRSPARKEGGLEGEAGNTRVLEGGEAPSLAIEPTRGFLLNFVDRPR